MLEPLGQILTEEKLITQEELNHCLEYKKLNPGLHLGAILKHHGFINDHQLAECLSKQINWKCFRSQYVPDHAAIEKIGLDYFCRHQIYPLKNGSVIPSFVVSFIDNVEITDYLKSIFGHTGVNFYIGPECDVRNALDLIVLEQNRAKLLVRIESLKSEGIDALASWLNEIINLAIITRSTDIHVEPTGKTTDIRFRIDGICASITCLKPEYIQKLANILLTKCGLRPCDYGIQDGSFFYEFKKMAKTVDVRFAQTPTIHGPRIVLRLLDKERAAIPLESLGFSEHNRKMIDQAIVVPHGLIIITGPTGSGKSTTLSAVLNQIKSISKIILTIEDPVEITHSLIAQVEVNPAQDLTFGKATRSFLRQDPNAILIGEIRDRETAQEAIRAANTGLQIFSTLHTNDPVSAILRLKDLGVDTVNISSCLVAVVSQRLVRKLCPFCKEPFTAVRDKFEAYKAKYLDGDIQSMFRPQGCRRCRNGFLGRTVVGEVLLIDQEIKELIGKNSLGEIYALLRQRGTYKTLIDDAKALIAKGETSIDEAIRVLG
ncbi:MAG: Flp pilus assembly complex ATPase component TadA [Candidatus Omnitrophica bacterium]|nr:Flp pilus assembly complex ATPase component TadA [Candidatus Omnitrophota bacterium]